MRRICIVARPQITRRVARLKDNEAIQLLRSQGVALSGMPDTRPATSGGLGGAIFPDFGSKRGGNEGSEREGERGWGVGDQ